MAAGSRGVAIIDLDNTVVRGSALFHFGAYLVRRRRIAARHVLRFAVAEAAYAWAHVEPSALPSQIAQRSLGLVRGRTQDEVRVWARAFAQGPLGKHVNADVALALEDFRRAGFSTFLATASPQELADEVSAVLGMDGAIGTTAEVVDGRYTGALAGPIVRGAAKAQRVADLFGARGFDASEAFALSDSVTDLPLLSMVGHPVATNPDRELLSIAVANGWRVLDSGTTASDSMARLQVLFPYPY